MKLTKEQYETWKGLNELVLARAKEVAEEHFQKQVFEEADVASYYFRPHYRLSDHAEISNGRINYEAYKHDEEYYGVDDKYIYEETDFEDIRSEPNKLIKEKNEAWARNKAKQKEDLVIKEFNALIKGKKDLELKEVWDSIEVDYKPNETI